MLCFSRLKHQHCAVVAALTIIGLAGCTQDDGIRQYNAEKIPAQEKPAIPVANSQSAQPAWFLKLTGPSDAVLKQIVPFSKIVKSLEFDPSGNPRYELPEGWTASNGPPPRYQTLKIAETDPPLEVTLSSLPGPDSAFDEYLLSNLNRWRGQLKMAPYAGDWLNEARSNGELVIVPVGERVVAMVNLVGKTPEQEQPSRMLAAVVLSPPAGSERETEPQSSTPAPSKPPLDFTVPAGWTASAGNAMRLASFEAKHESEVADVSVSRFPGGGDVLSNVNRWRGQVKLEPLDEAGFKSSSSEMQIGGQAGIVVEAIGPEQSILAAIVPDGDAKWFFKMQGPKDAVAAEKIHFEEFLKSVKFKK